MLYMCCIRSNMVAMSRRPERSSASVHRPGAPAGGGGAAGTADDRPGGEEVEEVLALAARMGRRKRAKAKESASYTGKLQRGMEGRGMNTWLAQDETHL